MGYYRAIPSKHDSLRHIDFVIDYFGERRLSAQARSVSGRCRQESASQWPWHRWRRSRNRRSTPRPPRWTDVSSPASAWRGPSPRPGSATPRRKGLRTASRPAND